ncbi:MAG: hypothetical protein R2815_11985 [Flavobacteriales bacterium]|nr:hypothetical protein [Flavobacteriales bacterium]
MNHAWIIGSYLALCPLICTAQALIVLPEADDALSVQFNPQFIQRNGIMAIVGEQMIKRDNEPMRTQKASYYYRFDPTGRTIYSNTAFGHPGTGTDTASVTYTYDADGRMVRRLRNDLSGHFAYAMEYDDQGRPLRETYTRIENLSSDRYTLIPGPVTEISDERFRYETESDTVWRKVYLNGLGLPYRERRFAKDAFGYLRSIEDRYLISNRRSRITFRYDEKGRLAERIEQPDLDRQRTLKRTWRYDVAGNVTEAALWHDDQHMERTEYLYEEHSMKLKARLTKDLVTGQIHVVRYRDQR